MTDTGEPEDPEATVARLQRELAEAEAEVRRKSLEAEITELTAKISNLQDELEEKSETPAPADSEVEHPNEMSSEASGDESESPDPTAEQAKIYYRKVAAVILVLAIAIGLGITFGNSDDSSNSSESIRKPSKAAALADKLAAGNVDQIRLDFDEKSLDAAETWARHQVPICKERNQRLRSEGVITESQFQDARKTCTFDFQEDLALRSMRPDWIDVCFELESAKIKGSDIASVSQSLWRRRITEERPKTKEFLESTPSWDGNSSSIQNQFIEEFTKSQVKDDLLTATDYLCPQHSRHINSLE